MKRNNRLMKRLLFTLLLIITSISFVGCAKNPVETAEPTPPERAVELAEIKGVPCVSIDEVEDNVAYYDSGFIIYGTVTSLYFYDFSVDSVDFVDYMEDMKNRMSEDITDDSTVDWLLSGMEDDIKNTYSYYIYLDHKYGNALEYETKCTEKILDIAEGDVIYAYVKPEKNIIDDYDLNVIAITVCDTTNRDESTIPHESEKITPPSSENYSDDATVEKSEQNDDINKEDNATLKDAVIEEPFFSVSGSGDDVVDGFYTEYLCYVHIEHLGNGRFVVNALHDNVKPGKQYGSDNLVYTTMENYSGDFFLGTRNICGFEVKATGDWTIEAYYIGTASSDNLEGFGDYVSPVIVSTSDVYEVETTGDGHFTVKAYYQEPYTGLTYEYLVGTAEENYNESVMLNKKGSQVIFVVESERDWKITPRK